MKKKKYLPLYERAFIEGIGPYGLCWFLSYECQETLKLFEPPAKLDRKIKHLYWGSDSNVSARRGEFTPLRQNIVLLMAALNGEL